MILPVRMRGSRCAHGTLLLAGIVYLLAGAAPARAQWVSRGPDAATINAIVVDPHAPSIVYVATSSGGVFRSADGGTSWTALNTGLAERFAIALAMDPVETTTLYAGTPGYTFRSTNGGETWTPANQGLPFGASALVIDPADTSTVYAGTVGGVFRSTNRGATWTPANAGMEGDSARLLAIDPVTPATLYAGTASNGVLRTTNGGETWTRMSNGLPGTFVTTLTLDPQNPSTVYATTFGNPFVYRSVNGGEQWSVVGSAGDTVMAFAVDPVTPSTLYAGTLNSGIRRSVNGGQTWATLNAGLTTLEVRSLAIVPQLPSTIYAGTFSYGGVFRSVDSGVSWTQTNAGLGGVHIQKLAIDPATPSRLYAGAFYGGAGLFRSEDGGHSWVHAGLGAVSTIAIHPHTPSTVYAGLSAGGVLRSLDAGLNWTPRGLAGKVVQSIVIDPEVPSTLYAAVTFDGIYKSTDAGDTWTTVNTGLTTSFVDALAINPQTPSIIYAGTPGSGVFRSLDGGGNWTAINTGLPTWHIRSLAIDPHNPSTVYATTGVIGQGGVFRSTNGGATWSSVSTGLPQAEVWAIAIDPSTPATLYAGTHEHGIYRSTNGGTSWAPFNAGLSERRGPALSVTTLAIHPTHPSAVYAGTWGASVMQWTQAPSLTGITPQAAARGSSVEVTLTGSAFHAGATTVEPGEGILLQNLQVVSPTMARATFVLDAGAEPGARQVTVTTTHGTSNAFPFVVADPFPDLVTDIAPSGAFGVGYDGTYTITVTNVGAASTQGPVTVSTALPPGVSFVSGAGDGWTCTAAGQAVTCVLATPLAPGVPASLDVVVALERAEIPFVEQRVSVITVGDLNVVNNVASTQSTIVPVPVPVLEFSPVLPPPGQQAVVALRFPTPFPHDISGTLTLDFTPDAVVPLDDPAIQFATGGRIVSFVVPANTLQARFADAAQAGPLGFQPGTVAGTLRFSGTLQAGRVDAPFPQAGATVNLTIPRRPPLVHSVQQTPEPFTVHLLLSSTAREVTQVSLQFGTSRPVQLSCGAVQGCSVSGNTMTLDVAPLFAAWFAGDVVFGSLATLRLPLAIDGSVQGTVSIRLHNSHGPSAGVVVPLP